MSDQVHRDDVQITVEIPRQWVENLEALVGTLYGPNSVTAVLAELADHAQQGIYRPGSWERDWLIQAFGDSFIDNLESDPDHRAIGWQRPQKRGAIR